MTELAWADIDLNAIAHNVAELRRITHPKARFMAVVKANAYGHGAIEVAKEALNHGAQNLGVARISEGLQLRLAGIDAPILVLGYTPPELIPRLIQANLTPTVYSEEAARAISDYALSCGKTVRIHIKTDTGMGRLGFTLKESRSLSDIETIARLPGIEIEGIFTHFATADSRDKTFAKVQLELFTDFTDKLRRRGLEIPVRHAANSAAIMEMPESHLDMVRAGIALYGLYPSDETDKTRIKLKPAMTLKSGVIHLKQVPAGFAVSYGCTYQTPKPTVIATVSIGYADGLNRLLSSRGYMLVRGQRAQIVGRVCMDLTMLDVGHIPDVKIGDEVVVFGSQENASVSVDDIASMLNTINYEIVSTITARVVRQYHYK
jgi:alanine racemase